MRLLLELIEFAGRPRGYDVRVTLLGDLWLLLLMLAELVYDGDGSPCLFGNRELEPSPMLIWELVFESRRFVS